MKPLIAPELEQYAEQHTSNVPPLLHELREVTYAKMRAPHMQVGRVEGRLLQLLVRLCGARRVLEIGMFTGYSALMMAEALPDDGELITCDVNPDAEAVARSFFERSPHGKKIQIRMGPALQTIASLAGPLDFVFIDADKGNYPHYFDAVLPRVRQGGLIVADNVLWSGKVIDASVQDEDTRALRAYADKVAADSRVETVLLTVRDGLLVARKK